MGRHCERRRKKTAQKTSPPLNKSKTRAVPPSRAAHDLPAPVRPDPSSVPTQRLGPADFRTFTEKGVLPPLKGGVPTQRLGPADFKTFTEKGVPPPLKGGVPTQRLGPADFKRFRVPRFSEAM